MSAPLQPRAGRSLSAPLAVFQPNRNVRLPAQRPFSLIPQSPEQAQAEFYQGAPDWEEDWPVKIEWMRLRCWSTAIDEAIAHALAMSYRDAPAETSELIEAMCKTLGYPETTVKVVLDSVWPDVCERADLIVADAEKAARKLIFECAPGRRIIAAAIDVFERHEAWVSRDWVIALCARLAQTRGRRRGG